LSAKAWPRPVLATTCTPSAPDLLTQSPRPARMNARSLRPVPETSSGRVVMARASCAKLAPNSVSRAPLASRA
jgi:hypothetical protein